MLALFFWLMLCSVTLVYLKNKTLKIYFDLYSGLYLFVSLEKIQFSFLDYLSQKILNEGNLGDLKELRFFYKFYGDILAKILELNYHFGISAKSILSELRDLFIHDIRFQKKIKTMFLSSFAQFLILAFCTWVFIFFAIYLLEINISWSIKCIIALLHLCGIGVFYVLSVKTLEHLFLNSSLLVKSLSIINLLQNYSLPQKKILEIAQVYEMLKCPMRPTLVPLRESFQKLLVSYSNQGKSIQDDLKVILNEYYYWQEKQFDFAEKILVSYKLVVILGFYLSSYFLFIYFLTIEMIKQG